MHTNKKRTVPFLLLLFAGPLNAQNPFQFHEACLLETKMWHSGEEYSAVNSQYFGREGPSPANQFIPDAHSPQVYASSQWLGLLSETDSYRRRGALALAEQQYLELLGKLRQAQGATSIDVGWMLDRLGEFYLQIDDFDKARQNFSEAIALRRTNVQELTDNKQQAALLITCRAHLVKLLVALGRIDSAKGDFLHADQELAEGTAMGSLLLRLQHATDAVYFESLSLEKQGKWKDAEVLWQQAMKVREKLTISDPYWDVMKETAAFYARRGDYHTAADLVKRIESETAGKQLRPSLPIPDSLEARQGARIEASLWSSLYKGESEVAMGEILALDSWVKDGPDAASALLAADSLRAAWRDENMISGRGSDAQQARWLAFLTGRANLHMSILLDGKPSTDRILKAYTAIQPVKDRFLDSMADITRLVESDRNNPGVSYSASSSPIIMLDELAKKRAQHSHFFVAAALDGKPFSNLEFAASEQAEQAVSEGLAYSKRFQSGTGAPSGDPSSAVPTGAAFIDIVAWERTDRAASPVTVHREYGAFVAREGQPLNFVRLGAADAIDSDIAALETMVVGPRVRGVRAPQARAGGPDETNQRLKRLYQEVMAPLEGSLTGVKKLLIVPDGKLTLAPIGAFIDARGQYVMQRYTVNYLGSWRDLFDHDSRSTKTSPPVVVANPDFDALLPNSKAMPPVPKRPVFEALPAAGLEASDVARSLHISPDRILTGKDAREETIRSLGGPEILHFATHSIPNLEWKVPTPAYDLFEFPRSLSTEDPLLQSVIVLAGGNRPQAGPEDGILTGLEVASLRLTGTKLVVLSTCEAGQGTPVDGQGVLGLRAAFSIAGARGLVMSLWPVDDKAGRLFMQYFYSHLEAGPAEAVRLSQLDMIGKSEFKASRYWAGYAYSGDPSVDTAPHAAPAPASGASKSPGESLVQPSCLQVTTTQPGGTAVLTTYRVKIAGGVHQASSSPEQVVYDLLPPASDLVETSAWSLNGGPAIANPDVSVASHHDFAISLTIERTKDQSALYVREYVKEGDRRYQPQTVTLITLKGAPNLFPTFDIPTTFPHLASYTEATVTQGKTVEKVDGVGACPAP